LNQPEHVIPFTTDGDGDVILIEGWIRGRPGRFVLDTGAGGLCIEPTFAERAGLVASSARTVLSTEEASAPEFGGVTVHLGGIAISCEMGVAMPMPFDVARGRLQADGILGYELFAEHVVEIDQARRTLRFFSPSAYPPDPHAATTVPISLDLRVPVMLAQLLPKGGRPITCRLELDSGLVGDGLEVILGHDFAEAHPEIMIGARGQWGTGAAADGQAMTVTKVPVRELLLGGLRIARPATGVIATETGVFHTGHIDGVVSLRQLRDRVVVLDYPRKRVHFHDPRFRQR
jgi:Aspartyl protease